uniref:EFR3 homolog Bb (S. cerevisiae) n=1 Tax=Astyanax mexicanus TaxID=7994 RepID=A0A8B9LJK5_ASTMX
VPSGVCGCCCGAFRPRYKRLVDNIFPEDPEDGLVKANMEKLTFYALSAPEKLDRIGAYLSERLSRDVARHRYGYVCIAMEALDQLLMACHCQSINLFVESFLKMVRKLLESDKPNLQILGTNSKMKFITYEDLLVDHQTSICSKCNFNAGNFLSTESFWIRMAGIKGLQGVVRKTVNDELQANIWDPQHMDKIVPSLLFNLQPGEGNQTWISPPLCFLLEGKEKESPAELTERCFRELLGRAAYGNIKNAVTPVLMHLDNHSLWEGKTFAVRCFKIIMYSIQSQHSHLVIQQLLGHLDANSKTSATVRAGIVEVLLEAAAIAASGSVGPTVLEVFNTLLRQLKLSVDYELTGSYDCTTMGTKTIKEHEERQLQEAVIMTIGSFANTLPTYQRSEVMLFIMGKIPIPGMHPTLQPTGTYGLFMEICRNCTRTRLLPDTTFFVNTDSASIVSFLDPLLSFALLEDAHIRLLVLEILVSLIDRHDNLPKFSTISIISDISVLKLKMEKCSRQDNLFMKKHAQQLYRHIYLSCKEQSSMQPHFEMLYTLLALISMELANEEVVVDLIRLALALQDLALASEETLPVYNRCAVHALSAAYLNLICQLTTVPTFCQHVHEVIEVRQKDCPFLLPEDIFIEDPKIPEVLEKPEGEVLFQQAKVTEVLGGSGFNTERLATPYIPQFTDEDRLSKRKSIGETISLQVEVESRNTEEITFEALKNAIVDTVGMEEQERARRRQVVEKFQKAPFEEIAAHCGARATMLQSKLSQIFEITIRPPPSPSGTITAGYGQTQSRSVPVYEMKFPDLCVY